MSESGITTKVIPTDAGFLFANDCGSSHFETYADLEAANLLAGASASAMSYRSPASHYGDQIIALAERIKAQRSRAAILLAARKESP